jgi:hypothetical protein
MKKPIALFFIAVILFSLTVFAQDASLDNKADSFVKTIAVQKGINEEDISDITELELGSLPEEITLQNIDETNLALYSINVSGESEPVYIITASSEFYKETAKAFSNSMLLSFGLSGEISDDSFLKTSAGVETSEEKGYVMTRDGTISGLSTNLEIVSGESIEPIDVIIYINSEAVGFRNTFIAEEIGIYADYDAISSGTISFEKGDVISLKVKVPEGIIIEDVISLIDIKTE